jgi:hypothetical protein
VLHNLLGDAASVSADAQRVEFDHAVEAAQPPRTGYAPAVLAYRSYIDVCTTLIALSDVQRVGQGAGWLILCFLSFSVIVLKLPECCLRPD